MVVLVCAILAQACAAPTAPTLTSAQTGELRTPTATLSVASAEASPTATTVAATPAPSVTPSVSPTVVPSVTPTAAATPTPTETPTMLPSPTPVVHVVEQGDLLGRIAQRYGISTQALADANGMELDDVLSIGQELIIPVPLETSEQGTSSPAVTATSTPLPTATPEPLVHVVARGEVLGRIAQQYGITSQELAEANGITVDDVLSIGQELVIPARTAAPDVATPTASPTAAPATSEATSTPTVPAATATATSAPEGPTAIPTMLADIIHTVQQGEYLGVIARRYGIDESEIARANGITSSTILRIGQQLVIPSVPVTPTATPRPTQASVASEPTAEPDGPRADVIHVVERGDTLSAIAVRYEVSSAEIAQANGISVNAVLSIGQELVIPSIPVIPTATPTATPTWTLTPTPTLTPTLARSSETYRFRAPFLLGPVQNTAYEGPQTRILLNWSSVGILEPNLWYLVEIWPTGRSNDTLEIWTKATSCRPESRALPETWSDATRFSWRVSVVERLSGSPPWRAVSRPSATRRFSWDRQAPSP